MLGDIRQNRRKRADAKAIVLGNGDVMLASLQRSQAKVAAGLTSDPVAKQSQGMGKIRSRDVAGKSHTLITSSRTK